MTTLRKIDNDEFQEWLFSFIDRVLGIEADMIFIYLFQEGSIFSMPNTLSERVKIYLEEKPEKKKHLEMVMADLLVFLVEKGAIDQKACLKEAQEINKILKGQIATPKTI